MGARRLMNWTRQPLIDADEISQILFLSFLPSFPKLTEITVIRYSAGLVGLFRSRQQLSFSASGMWKSKDCSSANGLLSCFVLTFQ